MKRTLFLLALLAASRAQALLDANVFGGYTTLAMGDLNAALDKNADAQKAAGATGVSATKIGSGFYVGADIGFTTLPFLKIGPKLEYIQANPGSLAYTSSGGAKVSGSYDANLLPIMLGLAFDAGLPLTGLSVKGGAWGGYGMAKTKFVTDTGSGKVESMASGSGFVAELAGSARYSIIPFFSIGLDLGYRLANIAEMKDDKTSATLKKSATENMALDYSGLNVGGSLNFNF